MVIYLSEVFPLVSWSWICVPDNLDVFLNLFAFSSSSLVPRCLVGGV